MTIRNLTGQRFGMLVAKELVVERPFAKKQYRCVCDCGKECYRLEATLIREKGISNCGCYTTKNLKPGNSELCRKAGRNRKNSFVNGSNVQMTFRHGTIRGNTSGVQGVSWSGSAHKWHVYVGYQNYRANLGFYDNMEDAIAVRKKAEESIKDGTFEDMFFAIRGWHLGERNSKQFKNR